VSSKDLTRDGLSNDSIVTVVAEVLRVAVPLMISAGTFSVVLFADRTLLLWHDGASMSASMAAGNLFWVLICLPVGIVSMTGAIISQHIGNHEPEKVGRLLWQSIWLSLMFAPVFLLIGVFARQFFIATGQPEELINLEAIYLRFLMLAAMGIVLETALSGFFSAIERTRIVMWVSIASGLLNLALDGLLIFGWGPFPSLGIMGAAIATAISFWFKVVCFGWLILRPQYEQTYRLRGAYGPSWPVLGNLLFFGLPTGLMYVSESGGFAAIILRIGRLGDLPLRATTMAINFNMVAFVPLVGVSVAASVLTGKHLLESGPERAAKSAMASLAVALAYASVWIAAFLLIPETLMSFYSLQEADEITRQSITVAQGLLVFVAMYLFFDTTQLTLAGALRGAGDTWFVLFAGVFAITIAFSLGVWREPEIDALNSSDALNWWWWITTLWIGLLAVAMTTRYALGRWRKMRMV
jgi:MATE family multidrug resistance protein